MEQRKQHFIDPRFQTKFILKFCAINLIASALTAALLYVLNRHSKTVVFENLRIVVKTTADFLLPIMVQSVVVVTAVVAIATIFIALYTSFRIAGPLHRLSIEFKRIREKDLSHPIHIRAKDQLKRFAAECEETRREYQRSFAAMQQNWQAVEAKARAAAQQASDPEEKRRLEAGCEALTAELNRFKTKPD